MKNSLILLGLLALVLQVSSQPSCPRFLCSPWPQLQNVTSFQQLPSQVSQNAFSSWRTGLNPNSQICFQNQQSFTNNSVYNIPTYSQYFMHTCPYPKYQCGVTFSGPQNYSIVNNSIAYCVLKQSALLLVGEWCYSNADCYSGLCDNRLQANNWPNIDSNTVLNTETNDPFSASQQFAQQNQYNTLSQKFYQNNPNLNLIFPGTRKCYVRRVNESCSLQKHCGKGLQCAFNPYPAPPSSSFPTKICLPVLSIGSQCNDAGNSNFIGMGWDLCPFGTICARVQTSNSAMSGNFFCVSLFNSSITSFQPYLNTTTNIPNYPLNILNSVCSQNYVTGPSNNAYTCSLAPKSTQWDQNAGTALTCNKPTDCVQLDSVPSAQYPRSLYLQQCTCSFWNINGNAYCVGGFGDKNYFTSTNVLNKLYAQGQNNNQNCYNYEIYGNQQMNWPADPIQSTINIGNTFPGSQCVPQTVTYAYPPQNVPSPTQCIVPVWGSVYNLAGLNIQNPWNLTYINNNINPQVWSWSPYTFPLSKFFGTNYQGFNSTLISWIPYASNANQIPGGPSVSASAQDQNYNNPDNYQKGTCPAFICSNIQTTANTQYTQGNSIYRGACALYDPNLNIWTMRQCRNSKTDFCAPCPYDSNNPQNSQCQQFSYYPQQTATFAFKCVRMDGKPKRIFEDCWDDSDCMSGICSAPGFCNVQQQDAPCISHIQCNRGLRCVYNPTLEQFASCQPAIPAGGACDYQNYAQCKYGSYCILVQGQNQGMCVNMYSLPGMTQFQFIDPTLNNNYNQFCSSGYYSTYPFSYPTYVNYTGCLVTPPRTYGGWPKECSSNNDCNSISYVNLFGSQNAYLQQFSNQVQNLSNGVCNCDFATSTPYGFGNTEGQQYCQGFDGERNNLQYIMKQGYARSFNSCFPYEIENQQLTDLFYTGGYCGKPLVRWYDPAPQRDMGSCYQQFFQNLNVTRTQAFYQWAQQNFEAQGYLMYFFQTCPVYQCITGSNSSLEVSGSNTVCRFFNETTNTVQLNACPSGQQCNMYNSTYWLCGYNPYYLKNVSQTCTFDSECITQYCLSNQCATKPQGMYCSEHIECGAGLQCIVIQNFAQLNKTQVNNTNGQQQLPTGLQYWGATCQPPLNNWANCYQNFNNGTIVDKSNQCQINSTCMLTNYYFATNTTVTNMNQLTYWQCVPMYGLPPYPENYKSFITQTDSNYFNISVPSAQQVYILQPQMTIGQMSQYCATNWYLSSSNVNNFNTVFQQNLTTTAGHCAFNFGWNATGAYKTFKNQTCWSNQQCVNNWNYTLNLQNTPPVVLQPSQWNAFGALTYGNCTCDYWNSNGYGFCSPFPSDYVELPQWRQYYAQNFSNSGCYPYEAILGVDVSNQKCNIETFVTNPTTYYTSNVSISNLPCVQNIVPFLQINGGYPHQILPSQQPFYFNTYCPPYVCQSQLPNSMCAIYSYDQASNNSNVQFAQCAKPTDNCTFYNSTLWLCQNQNVLKEVGDDCLFNSQCRSNMCTFKEGSTTNMQCSVASLGQQCQEHSNCGQNMRCVISNLSQDNVYQQKVCMNAIPNGGNCEPWSFDWCKYGSSCILQQGSTQPKCVNWYSVSGGVQFQLVTNYSIYTNNQYHPSLFNYFSQLCSTGYYDPIQGCRANLEVTQGGWPKQCSVDSDCTGGNYQTPGLCSCDNNNQFGYGYCIGFNGEANNMIQTYQTSYARTFANCYPYEINSMYTSNQASCGQQNYNWYQSAPNTVFGSCYAGANLQGPKYTFQSSYNLQYNMIVLLLIGLLFSAILF